MIGDQHGQAKTNFVSDVVHRDQRWHLILSIAGCAIALDLGYNLQSGWFGVPRESINVVIYVFLGVFKILWLIFNVVPYVALVILGARQRPMVPVV